MKTKTAKTKKRASMTKRMGGAAELLTIANKLADQVRKADPEPTWRERSLAALANPDRREGLIQAIQIQRDAGGYSADSAFAGIVRMASQIAEDRIAADAEATRISDAIADAERAHGLTDDEYWPGGEAP